MKNVLVTGAAGGMGRALCRKLSQAGYRVWGLDIAPEAESSGLGRYIQTDLTSEAAVESAFETVRQEAGELFALVHMAGIYELDSLVELSADKLERCFEVNVFAACRVNRFFLPLLQPGGRIVITTSELAPLEPLPFTGLYAVTKAALEKYASSLRMELQLLGYRVSVLRPGAVQTGLLDVSTSRLAHFCEHTKLYSCNARRFRAIVDTVEARSISPERLAAKAMKILQARHPRCVYSINRNPLLLLLNFLPLGLQTRIIRAVLRKRNS